MIQAAILAGGLGTRLYPLTQTVPKAMVEVAGRPFLESQIVLLKKGGVEDFVLLVGHMAGMISDYFGDGSHFGVRIRYSNEGDNLLDTAGAIRHALPLLAEAFFVTFADSYLVLPYQRIWDDYLVAGREALMVVYRNDGKFDSSDIAIESGMVVAYQKNRPLPGAFYINNGLMAMRRESIAAVPEGQRISLASNFPTADRARPIDGLGNEPALL